MKTFEIDPDDELDYTFDYTQPVGAQPAFLGAGETITSHQLIAETGITVYNDSESAGVVTYWVKDGVAGKFPKVTSRIVTNQGRTKDWTVKFKVTDR